MSKGIYCLIMNMGKNKKIQVGRRKSKDSFPKGFYCYVGSGMNNLEARIQRHLSKNKNKKWHIDYLLDSATILDTKIHTQGSLTECGVNERIFQIEGAEILAPGFGSSDCNCVSHLAYFKNLPKITLHEP